MTATLDQCIAAHHDVSKGRRPRHDWLMAMNADPALVSAARAELARLRGTKGGKPLIDCCHISKLRHATLAAMLDTIDRKEPPGE
jgi:hypothetical protein